MSHLIVTIDGPAGSGKTTVSCLLAKKLKFIHLNSGILYRSVARAAYDNGITFSDEKALIDLAKSAKFDFHLDSSDFHTTVEVEFSSLPNYSLDIESIYEDISSRGASEVATIESIRSVLTDTQRAISEHNSLVLEGRDAGTVVFPDAPFKFYLDASFDERVKRRVQQQYSVYENDKEFMELFKKIKADMQSRDDRDSSREASPLSIPEDAMVVDTDGVSIPEVVNILYEAVSKQ